MVQTSDKSRDSVMNLQCLKTVSVRAQDKTSLRPGLGYKATPGAGPRTLVRSPIGINAKIAQAAAVRRASNTASRQRRGRRVNSRKSFSPSSKPFAGVGVADGERKEAEREAQNNNVHH
jgi:hypothetical protein